MKLNKLNYCLCFSNNAGSRKITEQNIKLEHDMLLQLKTYLFKQAYIIDVDLLNSCKTICLQLNVVVHVFGMICLPTFAIFQVQFCLKRQFVPA